MAAQVHIFDSAEQASQALAAYISDVAKASVAARDRFVIALSGGATPKQAYQFLASPPLKQRQAWEQWHMFWSDERCAPPGHPDRNSRMAYEAMLDRAPTPSNQIHPVHAEWPPEIAARRYEEEIVRLFAPEAPAFDLVLLGIGGDGHTASLFPGSPAVDERGRLVAANRVPQLRATRITFTLPLINQARAVAFLATDKSKAEPVRQALEPKSIGDRVPATLVSPVAGELHWFLTREAASRLQRKAHS